MWGQNHIEIDNFGATGVSGTSQQYSLVYPSGLETRERVLLARARFCLQNKRSLGSGCRWERWRRVNRYRGSFPSIPEASHKQPFLRQRRTKVIYRNTLSRDQFRSRHNRWVVLELDEQSYLSSWEQKGGTSNGMCSKTTSGDMLPRIVACTIRLSVLFHVECPITQILVSCYALHLWSCARISTSDMNNFSNMIARLLERPRLSKISELIHCPSHPCLSFCSSELEHSSSQHTPAQTLLSES